MKNILTIFLLIGLMANLNASVVVDVQCESPDLTYLNRFTLNQSFEAFESDDDENTWKLYSTTIKPNLTKAGNGAQSEEASLKVSGTLKKIDSDFTLNPYYNLQLKSRDKKVLINLNLNYPSPLSSQIRTSEGRLYKATCKLVNLKKCIFENSLYDILESSDFTQIEQGEELKVIPDFNEDNSPVNTKKVTLTHTSGQVFNAWYTFEDEVDGGNTYGVIEKADGSFAAAINDGDIYGCAASL